MGFSVFVLFFDVFGLCFRPFFCLVSSCEQAIFVYVLFFAIFLVVLLVFQF